MHIYLLAASSFLAGCASPSLPPLQPVSSTQGITVVQTARITAIRVLPEGLPNNDQHSGDRAAGGVEDRQTKGGTRSQAGSRLTLLSDNGDVQNYDVEPGEIFQVGDRVKIISNNGNLKITH